jgi:radical SAM protein with 4Fe4S-binding SPASM domain
MLKRLNDFLRLLGMLNFSRIFNYLRLKIRGMRNGAAPFAATFEASAVCNLKCPECIHAEGNFRRNTSLAGMDSFSAFLRFLPSSVFYLNLSFQGEPLLNPLLPEMIKMAAEKKLYTTISTNAQLLDRGMADKLIGSGLCRIIISADGIRQETYEAYRSGGNFAQVTEAIGLLAASRKKLRKSNPLIVVQFLVHRLNEHEMKHAAAFFRRTGADLTIFKSMQLLHHENAAYWLPAGEKYRRYIAGEMSLKLKCEKKSYCARVRDTLVVTGDGDIVPCCYDKKGEYVMGNIFRDEFLGIWHGKAFTDLRRRADAGEPCICANCGDF